MANYVRIFSVNNVAEIHKGYLDGIRLAREIEGTYLRAGNATRAAAAGATLRELQRAYADFNADLDRVAKETAANARKAIRHQIAATRVRPDTGNGPHLRDVIRARPIHRFGIIATGEVGVADVDVLDALVNPNTPQYGPYWRSQEYGYQFRGKQLTGVIGGFYGPGFGSGPFRADSRYAGRPGPHPLFLPGAVAGGIAASVGHSAPKGGGLVVFSTPLKRRGFIAKGADAAEVVWRAQLARVEQTQHIKLRALTSPAAFGRRGRRP